ncbi:hypothetical protein N7513_006462 [Penicillium frequentans]|nr:hypothetical protein N7513_006462 [Penicillium glabrum]
MALNRVYLKFNWTSSIAYINAVLLQQENVAAANPLSPSADVCAGSPDNIFSTSSTNLSSTPANLSSTSAGIPSASPGLPPPSQPSPALNGSFANAPPHNFSYPPPPRSQPTNTVYPGPPPSVSPPIQSPPLESQYPHDKTPSYNQPSASAFQQPAAASISRSESQSSSLNRMEKIPGGAPHMETLKEQHQHMTTMSVHSTEEVTELVIVIRTLS